MTEAPFLVAIDGPSGVGKGTVARLLAGRLGVPYFDTGAMYRAVALAVVEGGVDPGDRERALEAALAARVELVPVDGAFEVRLDGRPTEGRIRTPEIGAAASTVSAYPEVRRRLVDLQRQFGRRHGGVMEGRDIGTRVFPDTPHKFFLDADPAVRHERRYVQLLREGRRVGRDEVEREMTERDERDRTREDSPLTCDESYERVDTTELTVEQVVDRLEGLVRARG